MGQRDGLLRTSAALVHQNKFDVYCIGMPERNRGLEPFEEHLVFTAERVGTGFELSETQHLPLSYNGRRCWLPNSRVIANSVSQNNQSTIPVPGTSRCV